MKVDVWDVVDKGKQREFTHGAKSSGYLSKFQKKTQVRLLGTVSTFHRGVECNNSTPLFLQQPTSVASLDSTFIDVYKGANGVILMFDVSKKW